MKIIHIISGGMDSVTLLYDLIKQGHEVKCLSFNYGQRHKKELESAHLTCAKLNVQHDVIDITSVTSFISNSALTGDVDVPQGHYEEENMKLTVVPSRNTIMLSIANGYAVNIEYDAVSTAVHAGDHAIYPDCRPIFIDRLQKVFEINNFKPVQLLAPYLNIDKAGIVKKGLELGVDYNLSWTCYRGHDIACGKCGSCQERLESFNKNGVEDPLDYETRELLPKQ